MKRFGNSDLIQQFNDIDNKYTKNCWKLIEENYVNSPKEVLDLYLKGEIQVIFDMELIHYIEKRKGEKL